MRRQDREVTDPQRIREIIDACAVCRLGLYDGEEVYIVPLNFGYAQQGGRWTLYFHGAHEGRKMELLRRKPTVSFEMDAHFALLPGPNACQYSARYQCVMGTGPPGRRGAVGVGRRPASGRLRLPGRRPYPLLQGALNAHRPHLPIAFWGHAR